MSPLEVRTIPIDRKQGLLTSAVAFGAVAVALALHNTVLPAYYPWFAVALFGAIGVIGLVRLLPGVVRVTLSPMGLSVRTLVSRKAYRWVDIADHGLVDGRWLLRPITLIPRSKGVWLDLRPDAQKRRESIAWSFRTVEHDIVIWDTWAIRAEELADLISRYRETYRS
jgi:hypothetical protein